jgi:hypothetical protein
LINKKRANDVKKVAVVILSNGSEFISTGMLSIILYQEQYCSEKVHSRHLKIGLYTSEGELVSDAQEFIFDSTSEGVRDREHHVDLRLTSKAEAYNNQVLYLKLTEKFGNTNQFTDYVTRQYKLRMTFGLDF